MSINWIRLEPAVLLLAALTVSTSCASSDEPAVEHVGAVSASVFGAQGDTVVAPGTPSTRGRSCPGRALPDQCGTWDGVELHASLARGESRSDEQCLCRPIEFELPATLPLEDGNAGRHTATLEFRKDNGRKVECRYEGDRGGRHDHSDDGSQYVLQKCSDGSKAGARLRADWFSLSLSCSDRRADPVTVNLRLGEPDVVDGEVQEAIFYSDDPRIPEAALHVPRGSAPAFQDFTLDVIDSINVGASYANGGNAFRTVGYGVDVRATGIDHFAFTPVAGASCPKIELPYSPSVLAQFGISPELLQARQITSISALRNGQGALEPVGPVTIDPTRRTIAFCVEHLSYYIGTVANSGWYSDLTSARFKARGVAGLGTDLLTATVMPSLLPGEAYELTLTFKNDPIPTTPPTPLPTDHNTWTNAGANALRLAAVRRSGATLTPDTGSKWFPDPSPWGTPVPQTVLSEFTPTSVSAHNTATFVVKLTAPLQASTGGQANVLNLCLNRGGAFYFGECFTWDPSSVVNASAGVTAPRITEVCDFIDNDSDGSTDESVRNACNSCVTLPPLGGACNNGQLGACYRTGTVVCGANAPQSDGSQGATSVRCSAPTVAKGIETCNGVDDDCDGDTDEGLPVATYYADGDGDGYGNAATAVTTCAPPAGYVTNGSDCDDADANRNAATMYYPDCDGDGYGTNQICYMPVAESTPIYEIPPVSSCGPPAPGTYTWFGVTYEVPYVTNADDCYDYSQYTYPGATEVCDYTDNNCVNGTDDEVRASYRTDYDGDGYCTNDAPRQLCPNAFGFGVRPTEACLALTDCNDRNRAAGESCDEFSIQGEEHYISWFFGGESFFPYAVDCGPGWHISRCEAVNRGIYGNAEITYCPEGRQSGEPVLRLYHDFLLSAVGYGKAYCAPNDSYPF